MCREELTLTPGFIEQNEVYVMESASTIIGFYALIASPPEAVLDFLYVHPDGLHHGVGRHLWDHALTNARNLGCRTMQIDADPNAEGFYSAMGAEKIGVVASGSIPGPTIPLMRIEL